MIIIMCVSDDCDYVHVPAGSQPTSRQKNNVDEVAPLLASKPCPRAQRSKTEPKCEQQRRSRRSQQKITDTTHQTTLDDYYHVRRSTRKCKSHIEVSRLCNQFNQ